MLAIEMSKGKMDLGDPDRDHARLIFLLTCKEHHRNENSRLILKQLLKTVQAHPGGLTAQALKKLIEHPSYAVGRRMCGRSCARCAPCRERSERAASLPPIELPVFSSGGFGELQKLEEHFGNLLEPRLYDRAHSDFLERLAMLAYAVEKVSEGNGRDQEISRLIGASGLQLSYQPSRAWSSTYVAMFVDRGRMLHELRGAFRPLVLSQPDAVQKLASLAHQIESRSAPTAKWLQDARAVRDMLPQEMWHDHLRRMTEVGSPYAGHFGVTGEAYLRTVIYLSALLRAEDVGPMLTDYALKQCYVTRKGSESGRRSSETPASGHWPSCPTAPGCPDLAGFSRG